MIKCIKPSINEFIENFKTNFNKENIEYIFMNGNCYHFSVILKNIFRKGKIVYNQSNNHFLFKLNNKYYDIKGEYIAIYNDNIINLKRILKKDSKYSAILTRDCIYKWNYFPNLSKEYIIKN